MLNNALKNMLIRWHVNEPMIDTSGKKEVKIFEIDAFMRTTKVEVFREQGRGEFLRVIWQFPTNH